MDVKTVFLDFGHSSLGLIPGDVGASGIQIEDKNIYQIYQHLVSMLEVLGYKVIVNPPAKARNLRSSLRERVNNGNKSKADLFVSIHFNAFSNPSAQGTEVFSSGKASKANAIGRRIVNNICALGYRNRGLKWGRFYVIRHTSMPALLVECHFITNKADCDRFDAKKVAAAIATGISGTPLPLKTENTDLVKFEDAELVVNVDTLLKPDSIDSSDPDFDRDLAQIIQKGTYKCEVIGEEEGHYLVKLPELTQDKEWFIFAGHVTIDA